MNVPNTRIKSISLMGLAVGCIIGWGSLFMPGSTFLPEAGSVGTIIGLIISAAICFVICGNYSYVVSNVDVSGGTYGYTKKIIGEDYAFLSAWALELAYISLLWANATAFVLLVRYFIGDLFQFGFHYTVAGYDIYLGEVLLTMMIIILTGIIVSYGKRVVYVLWAVLGIVLFASVTIIFIGVMINSDATQVMQPTFSDRGSIASQILSIVALAPWLFVGFEIVIHYVKQVTFKTKRMFVYAAIAVFVGMLIYIMLTLVASSGLPDGYGSLREYIDSADSDDVFESVPVLYNTKRALGDTGVILIGIAAASILLSSVLGFMRGAANVLAFMSEGGIVARQLSQRDDMYVPRKAVLAVVLISLPISFLGRTAVGWNADVSSLCVAIVYAYISVCAYKVASKRGDIKAKIIGLIGVACTIFVFLFLLVPNIFDYNALAKESYLMLAAWSFIGILYYLYTFAKDKNNRFGHSIIMWLTMMALMLFSLSIYIRMEMQEAIIEYIGYEDNDINNVLLNGTLIQIGIVIIVMGIFTFLFATMRKRERILDKAVIRAEEESHAKSDFMANMSHDIRTPMNAIIGFTNLALEEEDKSDKMTEYLTNINASGKHLLSLINDVLEMSRIESGKVELEPENVNLNELMNNMKSMLYEQAAEKDHTFTVDTSQITDDNVMCDRLRLNQILMNLVSNSIKYTENGGNIEVKVVELDNDTLTDTDDERKIEDNNRTYQFIVKDNGMGMSKEFADKIFDAFERERNSTINGIQGTGLGMAITKNLVDMMNGTIVLDTAKGVGSTFTVTLVLETCDMDEIDESAVVIDTEAFKGKRLLLTDDMMINREIAKAILEGREFVVDEAEDGTEAVEMVTKNEAGYYTAVLMDIQMPKMNGYEATKAIRNLDDKDKASIPIIAMTANAFDEDRKKAYEAGMNAHVAKPIDIDNLLMELSKVVH